MLERRHDPEPALEQRALIRFWAPLAAMWLLMACDQPFITALMARLPEARENLAAFAVAFAISLLIETPVITILGTTAALLKDSQSYHKLRSFIFTLNAVCTMLHILIPLPIFFDPIVRTLLGLEPGVADLCQQALWFMIPWSAAIGFRRFYQGVLINHNRTDRVAKVAFFRVISMIACGLCVYFFQLLPGASLGALALSLSVCVEAVVARLLAASIVEQYSHLPEQPATQAPALSVTQILHFYYPLTLTVLMGFCLQPINTFAIGHSVRALDSLAVLPVLGGLIFFMQSFALGLQETVIVLSGERNANFKQLRDFAARLGVVLFVAMSIMGLTSAGTLWLRNLSGLSEDLVSLAASALIIAIPLPLIGTVNCFCQGVIMKSKQTKLITYSTVAQLLSVCLMLLITVFYFDFAGIFATTLASVFGSTVACLFLLLATKRCLKM